MAKTCTKCNNIFELSNAEEEFLYTMCEAIIKNKKHG